MRLVGWTMEGDDEALALLAVIAVHVGLVLSHTVVAAAANCGECSELALVLD